MVGSERQGTRKFNEDYRPKIWKEIFDYVRGCLGLLSKIADMNTDFNLIVRKAVASIDTMFVVAEPVFPQYADLVRKLRPRSETWSELLDKLSWTIRHRLDTDDLKNIRANVVQLFEELFRVSLKSESSSM